jgi:hypothetical protein
MIQFLPTFLKTILHNWKSQCYPRKSGMGGVSTATQTMLEGEIETGY